LLGQGGSSERPGQARATLWEANAQDFLQNDLLSTEVFGPSGLIVRCRDLKQLLELLDALEGQLTIALHLSESDYSMVGAILPVAEEKAGRLLVNGFGTGVEVCHAMVHGGPWPATSDTRTTSVGTLAIDRFLRPVAYQNFPIELLPDALRDSNPLGTMRRIDGDLQ
jgi:NADP-dependent aldehyde dehydrogenase